MSWLAQVGHVLRKDARQNRWVIAITLLALAGAVVEAVQWTGASSPLPVSSMFRLVEALSGAVTFLLASFLLVVFVVQGDSPARSDAFWVARPLSASAVFAAKVVLIAFLAVLLPLVWEIVAIATHHLWSTRVIGVLSRSVLTQAALLVAVAVVAALTPDLRSFLVAFVFAVIGWTVAVEVVGHAIAGTATGGAVPTPVEAVAWLAGGLALVAYQYRVRDVRNTLRVFALPALLSLGLGAAVTSWPFPPGRTPTPPQVITRDLRVDSIHLEQPRPWSAGRRWRLYVHTTLAGGRDDYRYLISMPRLRVRFADGSEATFRTQNVAYVRSPQVPSAGLSWLGLPPALRPSSSELQTLVPAALVKKLADPGSRFSMEGRMYVAAPLEVGPLPVRAGAGAVADGRSYRLLGVDNSNGHPRLAVRIEGIESIGFGSPTYLWSFDFTLVNAARREAIKGEESSLYGDNEYTGHGMILWGDNWGNESGDLVFPTGVDGSVAPSPPVDDAWLDGAQLHITDWVLRGSYRIATAPAAVEVRQVP